MPHKFSADRRDKIPKQKQRVTNWSEYNEGLRRRGDLTVWISEDALDLWAGSTSNNPWWSGPDRAQCCRRLSHGPETPH